jgi:hypothetical protein
MSKLFCLSFLCFAVVVVSTICSDISEGERPELEVRIGISLQIADSNDNTVDHEFSSTMIPGKGAKESTKVELFNVGNKDLIIESVELLDTNLESEGLSNKNQYVTLNWQGGFNPQTGFPRVIHPVDSLTQLNFAVVYKPDGIDNNAATLKIVSNDVKNPVRLVTFRPFQCIPAVRIDPLSDTFFNATSTNPETKTFKIENDGSCEVTIHKIEAVSTSAVFTLHQDFVNGTKVLPKDEAGYMAASFRVTYKPNINSTNDSIMYAIYTSDPIKNPVYLSLGTKIEGCGYEVTYSTQAQGYLDFTKVEDGTKTLKVNILNKGPAAFTIVTGGVNFPADPEGSHYSWDICFPQADGSENCDNTPPVALGEEKSLDIKVTYKPATVDGLNTNLVVDYSCGGKHSFLIPAYGGDPKPCFDFAPGTGDSPNPIQFAGEKGAEIARKFVVYNCGNKDLTLTKMVVRDDFYPDDPSDYWTVTNAPAGATVIPVGGLMVFDMLMKVEDKSSKVGGTMYITYLDKNDVEVDAVGVDLQGIVDPLGSKPTAYAGVPADHAGATVGAPINLSGVGSEPGSEGLYEKGYLWYLLQKPAASQNILNGAPGSPGRTVIPDNAGKYLFGLQVHSSGGDFLYSDEVTIEVDVAAP